MGIHSPRQGIKFLGLNTKQNTSDLVENILSSKMTLPVQIKHYNIQQYTRQMVVAMNTKIQMSQYAKTKAQISFVELIIRS